MHPFLSTATLFGINTLPEPENERKTLLREARKRWQTEFQLEGETITLHGNTFSQHDILQHIEAFDDPATVAWHNQLDEAPEIRMFLETGIYKSFLLNKSLRNWPEELAVKTQHAFQEQFLHLFRRSWKNADTGKMFELNQIVIPIALPLYEELEELRDNYRTIEMQKLEEGLNQLERFGKRDAALDKLKDETHLGFWKEALQRFYGLSDIYSAWYYALKNRHAPAAEIDAVIEGCKAAMPLFGEYNWKIRTLIADHKNPVLPETEEEEEEEYDDENFEYVPVNIHDDDDDPYPAKKKKITWNAGWVIPMFALIIVGGLIGGMAWYYRDEKPTPRPSLKPYFETRYYLKPRPQNHTFIFVKNTRYDYDSIAEAAYYKAGGGNGGLTQENKKLYDSILNADLERVWNGDTTLPKNARGLADSLTPLVLPHSGNGPF